MSCAHDIDDAISRVHTENHSEEARSVEQKEISVRSLTNEWRPSYVIIHFVRHDYTSFL